MANIQRHEITILLSLLLPLFQYTIAYVPYVPPVSIHHHVVVPSSTVAAAGRILHHHHYLSSSSSPTIPPHSLLLAASNGGPPPPLQVRTQSQQMSEAMVLRTMRGTQWRLFEERDNTHQSCRATATFRGFAGEDNKGAVRVDVRCDNDGDAHAASGRWVVVPSSIRKGSIQLSARWKVRLPEGTFIYKGSIEASRIMGRNGSPMDADMTGVILTGEDVNRERVVGKFRGNFVRLLDESEAEFVNGAGNGGAISLVPKE